MRNSLINLRKKAVEVSGAKANEKAWRRIGRSFITCNWGERMADLEDDYKFDPFDDGSSSTSLSRRSISSSFYFLYI
jgi:hypothetical protein